MWAAEAARHSALDQIEMHTFPRALPEGQEPTDALRVVASECERMAAACRRLDAQVRALHTHRLDELRRDRAARQPHSDAAAIPYAAAPAVPAVPSLGAPTPASSAAALPIAGLGADARPSSPAASPRPSLAALPLAAFARLPDPHAAAAAASAHSCAATLCLRAALAGWLQHKQLPLSCLFSLSPAANSHKLDAVCHCAAAAGLTSRSSRQLVAAWLLREIPEAGAVPYDEEGEPIPEGGQPDWGAPPPPATPTPVAADALHAPVPVADLPTPAAPPAAASPPAAAAPPAAASPPTPAPALLPLADGTSVDFVGSVHPVPCVGFGSVGSVGGCEDQKPAVWDGAAMVRGKYDGEASGASFEPGPWRWDATAGPDGTGAWLRDTHPHEALILTPCGHAYSEVFWAAKLSTRIDQSARTGRWAAQRARCCAPILGGGTCGTLLRKAGGFRMTHCNPPRSAALPPGGGWAPLTSLMRSLPLHGTAGARVESAVRLLLALRVHAHRHDLSPCEAKVVVFSRFDATLTLLARACALNAVACLTLSAQCGSLAAGRAAAAQEAARFCADSSIQVWHTHPHRLASLLFPNPPNPRPPIRRVTCGIAGS